MDNENLPWVARFDGLDRVSIERRFEFRPEAISADQFRSKRDFVSALESSFSSIAIVSNRIGDILEKIVDRSYRHAVATYTGRQRFLANCNNIAGPEFPSEIYPQMLTGPAGVGKSTLIARLNSVLPAPTSIAVEAGYSKFPLTSVWFLSLRRNRAPRDMLRTLILSNGGTPSGTSIDDLLHQCRCMAYQSGTCLLVVDELQFMAKSQSASAAIVSLLFMLADIGIPVLYVANYSLGHKLSSRNHEDRERLLTQPHILLPDTVTDDDWSRSIGGFTALAPSVLKIDPLSDAARLHSYTAGSKRLLAILLRIAIDQCNGRGFEISIDSVEKAYRSTDYSAHRDDVCDIRLQFVSGQKQKRDLWCPFEIPATDQQEQARAADEFSKQELAESAIANSLTPRQKDILEELRARAADGDAGNVVPIGSKANPMPADFERGAEILKDL